VPVTANELKMVRGLSRGKTLPALICYTTEQDYNEATFVNSREYCTYEDLRSFRKGERLETEISVLSPPEEALGTKGGFGYKSPTTKKLQKRVRDSPLNFIP